MPCAAEAATVWEVLFETSTDDCNPVDEAGGTDDTGGLPETGVDPAVFWSGFEEVSTAVSPPMTAMNTARLAI